MISVRSVSKSFGETRAVYDFSFEFNSGEIYGVVGPSGSGKSTLLRLIGGLISPTAGQIHWTFGEISLENPIGFVFQDSIVYPHLTVAENLSFFHRVHGLWSEKIETRLEETLHVLDLVESRDRFPNRLSGGQVQRVAIARAVMRSPRILLLDEPFSNLDILLRKEARSLVFDVCRRMKDIVAVFVTHDDLPALANADQLIVLENGELTQSGTISQLATSPKSEFARVIASDYSSFQNR